MVVAVAVAVVVVAWVEDVGKAMVAGMLEHDPRHLVTQASSVCLCSCLHLLSAYVVSRGRPIDVHFPLTL